MTLLKSSVWQGSLRRSIRQPFPTWTNVLRTSVWSSHGPNTTHDSKDCKVINGSKKTNDWKKKDTSDSTDYKSKYKKKTRELNLLQK